MIRTPTILNLKVGALPMNLTAKDFFVEASDSFADLRPLGFGLRA